MVLELDFLEDAKRDAPSEDRPKVTDPSFKIPRTKSSVVEDKAAVINTNFKLSRTMNPATEGEAAVLARSKGGKWEHTRDVKGEIPEHHALQDMVSHSPTTADYLSKLENAAVSREDVGVLSEVERILKESAPAQIAKSAGKSLARFGPSIAKTLGEAVAFGGGTAESTIGAIKNIPVLRNQKFWRQMWHPYEQIGRSIKEAGLEDAQYYSKYLESPWLSLPVEKQQRLWDNPTLVLDPEWLTFNVGEAGHSLLTMIGATMVGGPTAGAAAGGFMEGGDLYGQLMEEGVDHDNAASAALAFGVTTGYLNKIGLTRLMKRLPATSTMKRAVHRLTSGAVEGATEYAEEPFQAAFESIAKGQSLDETIGNIEGSLTNIDVIPGAFIMGGAVNTRSIAESLQKEQEETGHFVETHQKVNEVLDQTNTKSSDPVKIDEFLTMAGMDENAYITPEGVSGLLQKDENELLNKMGVDAETAADNALNGLDTQVKTTKLHSSITPEEFNAIKDDIKPTPEARSTRQIADTDVEAEVQKLKESAEERRRVVKEVREQEQRVEAQIKEISPVPEFVESHMALINRFSQMIEDEGGSKTEYLSKLDIRTVESEQQLLVEIGAAPKGSVAQKKKGGIRGALTVADDNHIIRLVQGNADATTLLHELGHSFHIHFDLLARSDKASENMREDLSVLNQWFEELQSGLNPEEHYRRYMAPIFKNKPFEKLSKVERDKVIEVINKEHFARGFQKYMAEGEAPNRSLKRVFERFRNWLLRRYKDIERLNVELNPEIRKFFDRMLGARAEIQEAAEFNGMTPMTDTQMRKIGIPPEERQYLKRLFKQAMSEAESNLINARNKGRAELIAQWEGEAQEELSTDQRWQAVTALINGQGVDPIQAVEEFGEEVLASFPEGALKPGGMSITEARVLMNIEDIDEAVEALRNYNPGRLQEIIEAKSDAHDASFSIEEHLLNTEKYGAYLEMVNRHLSNAVDRGRDVPPQAAYKVYAEEIFDKTRVDVATNHHRYMGALRKAHRKEKAAILRGDMAAAAIANEQARLAHILAGMSKRLRDNVDRLKKTDRRIKTIKGLYRDQVSKVLQRFGLTNKTLPISRDAPSLRDFFNELGSKADTEMFEIVPAFSDRLLSERYSNHYGSLTVSELSELESMINYLVKRGRKAKNKTLADGQTEVKGVVRSLIEPMLNRKKKKKVYAEDSIFRRLTEGSRKFFAAQESLPFIMRRLDNFVSLKGEVGPNERTITNRINKAEGEYNEKIREFSGKLDPIIRYFQERSKSFPKKITDTGVQVPGNLVRKGRSWTFERVLSVALNMGNEVNIQRLTDGYGMSYEDARDLTRTLSDEDWKMVQNTWNLIDELWPELDAAFYRINDFHQEKVKPKPFFTHNGLELDGGYYPIKYDKTLSTLVGEWTERDDILNSSEALFPPSTPKQGMLKKRVKGRVTLPVKLDLSVLHDHIQSSIRFITHAEVVYDTNRIIRNKDYQAAVEKIEGEALYSMIRPALAYAARPHAMGLDHLDSFLARESMRSTAYILGLNRSVALKQYYSIPGYWNDIGRGNSAVGLAWYLKGIGRVLRHPLEARKAMHQMSPFMAHRAKSMDRDIQKSVRLIKPEVRAVAGVTMDDVRNAMFSLIQAVDFATVYPAWQGAYLKGMRDFEGDVTKAVEFADASIRHSQPSSQPVDLNHLQRSKKGWHRLFTLFSSFTQKFGQRQRYHYNAWRSGELSSAKFMSIFAMENIAPPIMMSLMFSALWGEDPEPEDLITDAIGYQFIGTFLVRDFVSSVLSAREGFARSPFDSPAMTGGKLLQRLVNNFIAIAEDFGDDDKKLKATLSFAEFISYRMGVPFVKVTREILEGIEQWESGEGTPANILVRNPKK